MEQSLSSPHSYTCLDGILTSSQCFPAFPGVRIVFPFENLLPFLSPPPFEVMASCRGWFLCSFPSLQSPSDSFQLGILRTPLIGRKLGERWKRPCENGHVFGSGVKFSVFSSPHSPHGVYWRSTSSTPPGLTPPLCPPPVPHPYLPLPLSQWRSSWMMRRS